MLALLGSKSTPKNGADRSLSPASVSDAAGKPESPDCMRRGKNVKSRSAKPLDAVMHKNFSTQQVSSQQ
jgi:hypothetical protein